LAKQKQIRVAVIGTGGMGTGHCNNLPKVEETKLVAVCDIDPATAKETGKRCGVKSFVKYQDLLDWGKMDGVVIATPHYFHPVIGCAAMKAGFHCLSEKPMAVTVGEADRFIKTAEKTGKVFSVMFQRRTEPGIKAALEIARSGRIGKLRRTLLISPEFRSQAYYDSGTWRATWKGEGGGILLNQAPHIMDIFVQLAGMPKRLIGRTRTLAHNIEVEDHAEALLEYENGAYGYFYTSTTEPGPGQRIEIVGDRGKLTIADGKLSFVEYETSLPEWDAKNTEMWGSPKKQEVPIEIKDCPRGHAEIARNWARAILYGEPLIAPGSEAIGELELSNAIILSSFTNKPVDFPIDRKEYEDLIADLKKKSTFKKTAKKSERITDPAHK